MHRLVARLLLGVTLLIGLPLGALGLYWLATFPDVESLTRTNPTTTALIDARTADAAVNGKPVTVQRTWVPLSKIARHLQQAVIVSEDASFYQHEGFDWNGLKDAAQRDWQQGTFSRGGSTITQQLAKNLYLSPDKSLVRKAREALITRALEHHLRKARILELYLNVVEWGRGVYGVEAAARHHFHKSAAALSAEEAAILAAMLPSPRRYDPLRMTPYLTKRQHQILQLMERQTAHPLSPSGNGGASAD